MLIRLFIILPKGSLGHLVTSAINVVSHKLLSVWKADLNTSLAAIELLGSLAKITVSEQSNGFPLNHMHAFKRTQHYTHNFVVV